MEDTLASGSNGQTTDTDAPTTEDTTTEVPGGSSDAPKGEEKPADEAITITQDKLDAIIGQRLKKAQAELTAETTTERAAREAAEAKVTELQSQVDAIAAKEAEDERAAMSEAERIAADLEEARKTISEKDAAIERERAVANELIKQKRAGELQTVAKAIAPDLPPFYADRIASLAAEDDFDLEAASVVIKGWNDEWAGYLNDRGIKPAPSSVGSASNPPAPPREDTTTEYEDLIARMEDGDDGALLELQQKLGTG